MGMGRRSGVEVEAAAWPGMEHAVPPATRPHLAGERREGAREKSDAASGERGGRGSWARRESQREEELRRGRVGTPEGGCAGGGKGITVLGLGGGGGPATRREQAGTTPGALSRPACRPSPGRALCSRPCRAGPRAWGKAQARPAPLGHASPDPLAAGPGRAWAGQKNEPWAGPTGSGYMAIYTGGHAKSSWTGLISGQSSRSHDVRRFPLNNLNPDHIENEVLLFLSFERKLNSWK